MPYKLVDLIDPAKLQELLDGLDKAFKLVTAILDNDGNVVTSSGLQDMCTKFHHTNPVCAEECRQSDLYILKNVNETKSSYTYKCLQGLVDSATPIFIDGKHLGNVFIGQFFLEPPNIEHFKMQAQKFGFDEKAYIEALLEVPVISNYQLEQRLAFIKGLAEYIGEMGLQRLKQIENEQRLSEAQHIAHLGSWEYDIENNRLVWSDETYRIFGMQPQEIALTYEASLDYVHPDDRANVDKVYTESVRQGIPFEIEYRVVRRSDGDIRNVFEKCRYLKDKFGNVIRCFGIVYDITSLKRTEEALKEGEAKYRALVEDNLIGVYLIQDGKFIYTNPQLAEIFGYKQDELINIPILNLVAPEDHELVMNNIYKRMINDPPSIRYTFKGLRKDGQFIDVEAHGTRTVYSGKPTIIGSIYDNTEQKKSEDTIRDLNAKLENRLIALTQPVGDVSNLEFSDLFNLDELQKIQDAFAEATGVASVITDVDGKPLTTPSNFCHLCEHIIRKTEKGLQNCYHSDATLGREHPKGPTMSHCLSGGLWDAGTSIYVGERHIANWLIGQILEEPVDEEAMMAYAREIGADEEEYRKALAKVTRMPLEKFKKVTEALYLIANQLSVMAIQNVQQARFITERKNAEEALQREKAFTDAVFDSVPGLLYLYNDQRQLIRWNKKHEENTGYSAEELDKFYIMDWFKGKDAIKIKEAVDKVFVEGYVDVDANLVTKSGATILYAFTGLRVIIDNKYYLVGIGIDISERKRAEEALKESEEQLRTLINVMPDIVCFKDGSGRWQEANDFDLHLFGLTGVDYRGKKDSELAEYSKFYRDAFLACEDTDELAWNAGVLTRSDEVIPIPGEAPRVFDIIKIPTYYPNGKRKGLVVVGRDITERIRAEEERRKFEEHLEKQKRMFYRDSILSVTDGKLEICDSPDIEIYISLAHLKISVDTLKDISAARHEIKNFCEMNGLVGNRLDSFMDGVGEAIANAIKHGVNGNVYGGITNKAVWVAVSDEGNGIESLVLPRAILSRGFSTKPSMGLGYTIILDVADHVMLDTGPNGTTVLIIKNLVEPVFEINLSRLPDTWASIADLSDV